MARECSLPPSASSLSESLRDLGYSLETAIADLIDNSISARANFIEILCDLSQSDPALAIIDNGRGMTADELFAAMRHGSTSPKQPRAQGDLGRFGLGLKTASFSQCRRLTVISAQKGIRSGAEWNLDLIDRRDDWIVTILEDDEIAELPFSDRIGDSGTVVIWRTMDRLFEDESGRKRDEIVNEKLDVVDRHLSLVFHRFLAGQVRGRKKLSISINGHELEPFDPFCLKNSTTQILPEETVRVSGTPVHMQPYILPHHNRLTASEYNFYQDRSDFISNQGAYIYRNSRLMAWGDWFRLIPKGEATKLARVQIDFPTSLDESWTIDIRKSRAKPPRAVRERLRQIITRIAGRSTTVHRGRGRKLFEETKAPMWERYADQDRIRYALNGKHPLVEALRGGLENDTGQKLDLLLETVSAALPVEMIYSDYSIHPRQVKQSDMDRDAVIERLAALKNALFHDNDCTAEHFREVMRSTRLFEDHLDIAEEFIQEVLT
ncbi:MAG: ATP-binding protein [Gammaproteobacteria bacterium]|nr:ATP-binding protein [Gammaproteobacteria bacterium]MDE0413490.1 ATP-binding protein [Gammaproteobacteria bacterium]